MKLKEIYTAHFPKKGFTALTIIPFVFVRKDRREKYNDTIDRHEHTHGKQQVECLILGAVLALSLWMLGCGWYSLIPLPLFFELYFLEWIIKIPFCKFDTERAYMSISFEWEAYAFQTDKYYNRVRNDFAWINVIFKIKPEKK